MNSVVIWMFWENTIDVHRLWAEEEDKWNQQIRHGSWKSNEL